MMTARSSETKRAYSEVLKQSGGKELSSNKLIERILKFRDSIPDGNEYEHFRTSIEDIVTEVNILLTQTEKERKDYQNKIHKLEVRVCNLEEELASLRTIEIAEAVKLMEIHVATFVLPGNKAIATVGAFTQMLEHIHVRQNEPARNEWKTLQDQCAMKWLPTHDDSKRDWIMYRNTCAHTKKFDLANLKDAMEKQMPHRSKECKDFVNLLQKVDSLMKLGKLVSEFVESYARDIKSINSASKKQSVERFVEKCCRDVKYLQDIPTKDAKAHLDEYIPRREIGLWNDLLEEMESINRARLGKLVRDSELQVVSEILQDPAILTFDDMVAFLSTKRATLRDAHQWGTLTKGITWSKEHGDAMKKIRKIGTCIWTVPTSTFPTH